MFKFRKLIDSFFLDESIENSYNFNFSLLVQDSKNEMENELKIQRTFQETIVFCKENMKFFESTQIE